MSIDLRLLKKVRCRMLDETTGRPVGGVVVSVTLGLGESVAIPVGTLRTDATGYAAFDLQPFITRGMNVVSAVYVHAPSVGVRARSLLDLLGAGPKGADPRADVPKADGTDNLGAAAKPIRFMLDHQQANVSIVPICIEFPIYIVKPPKDGETETDDDECGCKSSSLASVQAPDSCDYRLSPYSFVTPAKIPGGDCCESLTPSTLPLQEHGFYRVVVRHDALEDDRPIRGFAARLVDVSQPVTPTTDMTIAEVLEFRQRWYSLGHSLGEIKYSLPLAPGESTQLAVIEWSREDVARREDEVRGTEYLEHELRRDRSIEESIDSGLQESQHGWSWMGGLSTGAAYDAGPYGKYTGNAAAGGSVSNSWGDRQLEADSLQDLHDKVTQATSYVRSLKSTVIVQASQAERNAVQTRRVANHNHCHALTVQYYEVLRHFRIETAFVRRSKALLVPFSIVTFSWEIAIRFRLVLERALLDRSLVSAFDAIMRLRVVPSAYTLDAPPPPQQTPASDNFFSGTTTFIVNANEIKTAGITLEKDSTVNASATGSGIKFSWGDVGQGYTPQGSNQMADHSFPAEQAHQLALVAQVAADWYEIGTGANFTVKNSGPLKLQFNDTKFDDNSGSATVTLIVTRATKEPGPTDPSKTNTEVKKPAFNKTADELSEALLLAHLKSSVGYYSRAVWMMMDPTERRLYLEAALSTRPNLLAALDDLPIAVSGNHVAFPFNGPVTGWEDERDGDPKVPLESIVTLPTRGLFAEAQLGHCNSCEKRDITRMWDWTEATTEEPPAITGIQPGPQGQMPALTPSALPSNVIQITSPPQAPDPTGLANALQVMKTPDIFRDMANLDEVSTLLGKLADGTVKTLSDMMNGAAEAKGKVDAVRENNKSGETGSSDASNQAKGPSASDLADRFSLLPEIKTFAEDLGLDSDEFKDLAMNTVYGTKPAPTPKPPSQSPKPKTGAVQIQFQVVDAWNHRTDANFEVTLRDDVVGDSGPLRGQYRTRPASSSDEGWLPATTGVKKGLLNVRVQMLSESYDDLASEVVDVLAVDVPYNFPAGTNFARFTARQETDEVTVTVQSGESLADKVGSSLSGTAGVGAEIKIVELSLEGTYGKNWETEMNRNQTTTREFKLKVPKASLDVKQTAP